MKLVNLTLPLNKLLLDPNNYRLDYDHELREYEKDDIPHVQDETLSRLEKEKLGELRESISQNGFLEMDRIVVQRLDAKGYEGFYLVVEGNRRTAAFKGLIEDHIRGDIVLSEKLIDKARAINVVCIEGSEDEIKKFSAGLMGVRHVSGPKKWSGYQSARLINDRHLAGDSFEQIGALLGISDLEAKRRFRNYRAFTQMKMNENYGERILQKHYTLLSEFLSPSRYARDWLNWTEDKENDIYEFQNQENLENVYKRIVSGDGQKAEITNVTKAREFLDFLESEEHREAIEIGVPMATLPPLHKGEDTRIKLLKDFLHYLNSLGNIDITQEECSLLEEVSEVISSLNR